MDEARAKAFRSLKPPCVELSQLVLRFKSKNATGRQVSKSTESLHNVLQNVSRPNNALNEKLGEYVFFPLSHIFRDSKELPTRAVEVALQCLDILITCAWRSRISPELGKQLLILLSFLAGGNSVGAKTEHVNEELGTAAFQCLRSLFTATGSAGLGEKGAIKPENIPVLGNAITVALDGMNSGPSVKVRLAASNALNSMIVGISDEEALRRFFPGIVSSLTKVARSGSGPTFSFKLLQTSIQALEKILNKVISDQATFGQLQNPQQLNEVTSKKQKTIESWVKATSSQVKLALANMIALQYHERFEVRYSLFQLCGSILQNCKKSLNQSIAMMAETLIVLCSQMDPENASELIEKARGIFLDDADLLESSKSSLHDWILALPRIMQSNDDAPKRKGIARISTAFQLITTQNVNSDILNDAIAVNLRASVSSAIQASSSQKVNAVPEGNLELTKLLQSSSSAKQMAEFRPILFNEVSQKDTLIGLRKLAQKLKVLPMSDKLEREIVKTLRMTAGDEQLASLWLSLQLLNPETTASDGMEQYLNFPDDPEDSNNELLDEVYSFSLEILSRPAFEDESNWKLQALALETVALQAHRQKQDFRPELVDALYPILERMGSSNAALQHHSMTCLNLVSASCGYPSPGALVIDNADYLVNAVALKLNTFDISPQAPQVLIMMVKLCGPGLIPYLDDLVESVFSILACYHGYPRLVESLFALLHAIVEESVKSPLLAIGPASTSISRQPIYHPIDISSVAVRLRKLNTPTTDSSPPSSPSPSTQSPQTNDHESSSSPPPPTVLLNTISLLTQHHLTTPSLPLLLSLLSLLTHAFPPLSAYPDTLLPLLATLFPLLIARLHDDSASPQVCIAAAHTLSAACRAGGDFLASRFHDEWDGLRTLCRKCEREMRAEQKTRGRGVGGGLKRRAWEAVRSLVCAVIEWVGVSGGLMEDGVFDILWGGEHSEQQSKQQNGGQGEQGDESADPDATTRSLLHALNPDHLWLLEQRATAAAARQRPRVGGRRSMGGEEGGEGEAAWMKAPEVDGWMLKDVLFL